MKIMLSIPSTNSRAVSVKKATHASGDVNSGIKSMEGVWLVTYLVIIRLVPEHPILRSVEEARNKQIAKGQDIHGPGKDAACHPSIPD